MQHAARRACARVGRVILRPVGTFRLFFGVQMVEIAKELVEAMDGGQILVAVAQMVLAELAGRIAQRLQRLGNGDVARLQADGCARYTDLRQARALWRLAGDEG